MSNNRRSGISRLANEIISRSGHFCASVLVIFVISLSSHSSSSAQDAEDDQLLLELTMGFIFEGKPFPLKISISGDFTPIIIPQSDQMELKKTIGVKFSKQEPREAAMIVTADWQEGPSSTIELSFLPSQVERELVILLVNGLNITTNNFNDKEFSSFTRKSCDGSRGDQFALMKVYQTCGAVYRAYRGEGKAHLIAALRALKGQFDAYWNLRVKHDIGFGRDSSLQATVTEHERLAKDDSNFANAFKELSIPIGYFRSMIDQENLALIGRFDRLKKDVTRKKLNDEQKVQARVEAELIKKLFVEEQVRLGKNGKPTDVISRITIDHFGGLLNAIQ